MRRLLLLVTTLLMAPFARGGVDQGNPKMTFYNMKKKFRITFDDAWAVTPIDSDATLQINVVVPAEGKGYFVVGRTPGAISAGFNICAHSPVKDTTVNVYWIGQDCQSKAYSDVFEKLKVSVRHMAF